MKRDAAQTRARILDAATTVFALRGRAGARIDEIAELAGINKQAIYYHFEDKDSLFAAVLDRHLVEKEAVSAAAPTDLAEALPYWMYTLAERGEQNRLLQWEALECGFGEGGGIVGRDERRSQYLRAISWLRNADPPVLDEWFDAEMIMVAMLALSLFPVAFPQLVELSTGLRPDDPEFRTRYAQALAGIGARLASASRRQVPDGADGSASGRTVRRRPDGSTDPEDAPSSSRPGDTASV